MLQVCCNTDNIARAHTNQDPTIVTFQSLAPEIVIKILSYVVTLPHDIRVLTEDEQKHRRQRHRRDSVDRPALPSWSAVLLVCKSFHEHALSMIFKRNRIVFPSVDFTDSLTKTSANVSPDGFPRA